MMPDMMERTLEQQHQGLMAVHNSVIIDRIAKNRKISSMEAIEKFYNSKLYALYEDESTKLWHFSYVTIADLLDQELDTGDIEFPEEG